MDRLTAYEVAHLVAGAERVALVVFVTLVSDGRLEVAPSTAPSARRKAPGPRAGEPVGPGTRGTWTRLQRSFGACW
ncbi:MAG: hypothetical protein HOV67_31485 [Kribbellaceae bacterium]|nr:hypothetical protein [Kribbellaceae bacterium]